MAIDRIDWHTDAADFPQHLPEENAGVHIGFFLAWAFEPGMAGELHIEEDSEALDKLARREISGVAFLLDFCDGKLWDEDFNEEGQAFAADYYGGDSDFSKQYAEYLQDYNRVFNDYDDYHVENTWENYDKLKPVLNERFAQWQQLQAA